VSKIRVYKLKLISGMVTMIIQNEFLPTRCEICHQIDYFMPEENYCFRCTDINIGSKKLIKQNIPLPPFIVEIGKPVGIDNIVSNILMGVAVGILLGPLTEFVLTLPEIFSNKMNMAINAAYDCTGGCYIPTVSQLIWEGLICGLFLGGFIGLAIGIGLSHMGKFNNKQLALMIISCMVVLKFYVWFSIFDYLFNF
jgi:small basic protein